jgi:thiol-disulfide isomerase/thioredoxin
MYYTANMKSRNQKLIYRRTLLISGASLMVTATGANSKALTRAEEQAAAKQAAQMVAEETGEKPHSAAGSILNLQPQINLLNGQLYNTRQHANKVLLIYFWASWCPICKVLGPRLQEFWLANRNKGIELLSIGAQDSTANMAKATEQRKYQFPMAMVSAAKLPVSLKPRSLPTLMVRSKLGVIVTVEEGDLSNEELQEFLVHI